MRGRPLIARGKGTGRFFASRLATNSTLLPREKAPRPQQSHRQTILPHASAEGSCLHYRGRYHWTAFCDLHRYETFSRRLGMRTLLGMAMAAALLTAVNATVADAAYCGAGRHCCSGSCCEAACCPQTCCTVMRTCRQVVYDQQQITCYRTCYEPVCEQKTVDCVRYVPETRYRECTYTVVETDLGDTHADVQLHGGQAGVGDANQDRNVHRLPARLGRPRADRDLHGVQAGVGEPRADVYLHGLPSRCTRTTSGPRPTRSASRSGRRRTRTCNYTVAKPVYETREREVCYTVCRPETYTQTVRVCSGHWETRCVSCRRSLPVLPAGDGSAGPGCPRSARSRSSAPATCRKPQVKKVPYQVCRMEYEQRTAGDPVPGLPHGVRAADARDSVPDVPHGVRAANARDSVHGLPHGVRATHPRDSVHRSAAWRPSSGPARSRTRRAA